MGPGGYGTVVGTTPRLPKFVKIWIQIRSRCARIADIISQKDLWIRIRKSAKVDSTVRLLLILIISDYMHISTCER